MPGTSKEDGGGLARSWSSLPRPSPAGGVVAARGARARAGEGRPTAAATPRTLLGYRCVHSGAGSGNTSSTRPLAAILRPGLPLEGRGVLHPRAGRVKPSNPRIFRMPPETFLLVTRAGKQGQERRGWKGGSG